ncbi:ACP S-malonyltransferase [Sorangium sp. So ce131]|uniref:ACP S-malonyltransferase n=1 Tax=Sorangium sp. So ce131 TaxID=3133282 RepID=UPI003F5D8773
MARKTVFMFSGQGSHYYGMGRELFETHPVFRASLQSLDSLFQELGGPSVLSEIHRGDRTAADWFDRLCFSHPAIFMIELALFEALKAEGIEPDCLLGASLGEYTAAAAAGALSAEEVARCIAHQVKIIEALCPQGTMLAVLGDARMFEREQVFRDNAELAAINFDHHFVVSGLSDDVSRIVAWLDNTRVMHQRLPVAYPFHSRWMDVAADPYRRHLASLTVRKPSVPLMSCETAGLVDVLEPAHFWRMVRAPIRFREAVRALEEAENDGCLYVDLGPTGTLASFAKHNLKSGSRSEAITVLSPFSPGSRGLGRLKQAHRRDGSDERSPVRGAQPVSREEKRKVYLFPGQGSQARGMGAELFEEFPELTATADRVLGYSIARLCREDPERQLDQTQFTQPALFVVNALLLARRRKSGERPAFVAGHSLGEYNALLAADAFDFETGLRLVQERAALMARAKDGGMAAVLGLDEATVGKVLADNRLDEIALANYNGARQFILAGPRESVLRAQPLFLGAGALAYVPLRVSGAFHSRYMEPARREFEGFLAGFKFRPLAVPVIANVSGKPYEPDQIARMLAEQLTKPVRWDWTLEFLLRQGDLEIEEVGPGNVLTKLLAKVLKAGAAAPGPAVRLDEQGGAPVGTALRATNGVATNGVAQRSLAQVEAPPPVVQEAARRAPDAARPRLSAESLGSAAFRQAYGLKYAYVCGAMFRGIASEQLVIRAARAGILSFFGTGGLDMARVEQAIARIQGELRAGEPYGMNLVHNPRLPSIEEETVDIFLKHGIRNVEAAAFMQVTPALVRYRLKGLRRGAGGAVEVRHRILAKVSRPEITEAFLAPAPERIVQRLLQDGKLTAEEARLGAEVPMADDLCVEADSGGHTEHRSPIVLLPTILRLRDQLVERYRGGFKICVGAAGGIGTPEAAAAVFVLGADFILTGSINQCTVESGVSSAVKDTLEQINIQDTDYAPAGDMFEMGAKVQVLRKSVLFPARAKKLYELYRQHESLDEIDPEVRAKIEQRYFRRSLDEVYRETREHFLREDPREIEKADQDPKHKMALVFRWYFGHSQRLAMEGDEGSRVDYQVHCGPALGAFNQWVKGTALASWRNRHVDEIAQELMRSTAEYLNQRFAALFA